MCNLGTFFKSLTQPLVKATERAFTAPGTGGIEAAQQASIATADTGATAFAELLKGQTAALEKQTAAITDSSAAATAAAATANEAQSKAIDTSAAAAVPLRDQESVRRAAEDRQRRLLAMGGVNLGLKKFGTPPVGYRMLSGQ